MSFLQRSVLALRVLIWVLAVSLGVFVLATSLSITHERQRLLVEAQEKSESLVEGNLKALGVALWTYDTASLSALMQGMIQSSPLVKIEIRDDKKLVASYSQQNGGEVDKRWSVPVMSPDGKKQIGTLSLAESYAEVDNIISASISTLVITQLFEVIGLAIAIFIIVYRLVARHLHELAEAVVALDPSQDGAGVALDRKKVYHDELDTLVTAINRYLRDRSEEMTKRAAVEATLHERVTEIEVVLGALSDGVVALDAQCHVRYANPAARNLLASGNAQLEGRTIDEVLTLITEPEGEALIGLCPAVLRDGEDRSMRGNVLVRSTFGPCFDARVSVVLAPESGDVAVILVFTDISAEISKERRIEFQAFHDPLTGLGNRSLLARDLPLAIASAGERQSSLAVLCLDLDNFKNINDALGHSIGDVMLRDLAERLSHLLKDHAWVTRYGGDEFIIVMPDVTSRQELANLAEEVMGTIAKPFMIEGHELRVTSSIGISLFPDHGTNMAELISNADMAMYEAKRGSRNAYRFYETGLLRRSADRLAMENGLRIALQGQQFSLVFQPKISLSSGRIDSLEALLRWPGPHGSGVSPAQFIPVAEETGLIIEIGSWVLAESLAAARRLRDALGFALPVAVNVSPIQFRSDRLLADLKKLAENEPDFANLLQIELTESALAGNIQEVTTKLEVIRAMGLKIAIDDFGTGYSSLAYLRNFAIDILKIDQAFIRELHVNAQDRSIVDSIVHLGKNLGFALVAEGVEEVGQRDILAELGCDYAQGYWYARPLPEGEIVTRYRVD